MTPERAKQIHASQTDWPYWGNYQRTMSEEEVKEVRDLWQLANGNTSFADIVRRIAQGRDPVTGT